MRSGWLWALAAIVGPRAAMAHTTPATLGVVGVEGGEPFALRLAHGLALRDRGGSWRFVCPSRWGGPALALAEASGPDELWVIGDQGPVRIDRDGQSHPLLVPALTSGTVRRLIAHAGGVLALAVNGSASAVDASGASLWRLSSDTAQQIYQVPDVATSIATDGQHIFVGWLDAGAIVVDTLGTGPAERQVFANAAPPGLTLALEYAGGALWARLNDGHQALLLRLQGGEASLALLTEGVLLGPVDQGGRALVAVDQALSTIEANGPVPVLTSTAVTCLDSDAGATFGCAKTRLFALATPPEERFSIAELVGPTQAGLDGNAALSCQIEWLDLASEAGLDPKAEPAVMAQSSAPPATGCSCLQRRPSAPNLAGLGLLALWSLSRGGRARRGRQRPDPGIEAAGDPGRGRQPPSL